MTAQDTHNPCDIAIDDQPSVPLSVTFREKVYHVQGGGGCITAKYTFNYSKGKSAISNINLGSLSEHEEHDFPVVTSYNMNHLRAYSCIV